MLGTKVGIIYVLGALGNEKSSVVICFFPDLSFLPVPCTLRRGAPFFRKSAFRAADKGGHSSQDPDLKPLILEFLRRPS